MVNAPPRILKVLLSFITHKEIMPNKTTGAVKPAPFKTESLSLEQKEQVVADYIGIHPKYFWYRGVSIDVDLYKLSKDGINWTGFGPDHNKGK